MSNVFSCAPLPTEKAAIVGLTGKQFRLLQTLMQDYPITLRNLSLSSLFRRSSIDGLVVVTRFVSHKHSWRAQRIATNRLLRVDHGTARAVFAAVREHFGW